MRQAGREAVCIMHLQGGDAWTSLLSRCAEEVSANNTLPEDYPERVADRLQGHLVSQREKFEAWQTLGDFYADTLANPKTPAAVHNVLNHELDLLTDRAGLHITSPEVLRLL